MVYSSKALHSYFEDNFFGHGQKGCNGVDSEEDELGYVCWTNKPRATLAKGFYSKVVKWWQWKQAGTIILDLGLDNHINGIRNEPMNIMMKLNKEYVVNMYAW